MAYSFPGGVNVKAKGSALHTASKPYAEPPQVAIPLYDSAPTVSVGDFVDIGTCIAKGAVPCHASVSGTVTAIEDREGTTYVIIKNDMRHTLAPKLQGVTAPLSSLTAEDIIQMIDTAGIVDAKNGEAVAHTLRNALGKVKRVVINCTDSEPWQTSSYRCVSEQHEALIKGIKLLIYTLGARKADIAIEENKGLVTEKLESVIEDKHLIDIKLCTSKHPISISNRLIFALYGKRVPAGKSPADAGFAVFTPETAVQVYRTLSTGIPMIHKRVSVGGEGILAPENLIVPIGTEIKDIAKLCGGTKKRVKRIIKGGPLTGKVADTDGVVDKYTDSVIFLTAGKKKPSPCIRCGACVNACPVGLTPSLLAAYGEKGLYGESVALGANHCIGCGCCAYVCPAAIPIVYYINKAKEEEKDEK